MTEKGRFFVKRNRIKNRKRVEKMHKELIISVIIVIAIIVGNIITQNDTKQTVDEISTQLSAIREKLLQEDEEIEWEKTQKELANVRKIWNEKYEKMAYYIEHNQLEKVETNLTSLESYTEKQDSQEALNQLDSGIFILKHIQDKNALDLKNIF